MQNSWPVLIPPIIVLLIAILRKNVITALIVGILSASYIATDFNILNSVNLSFNTVLEQSNLNYFLNDGESLEHFYTFGFLLFLGIIIALITHTGGASAFSKIIQKKVYTKKNAESISLCLSTTFFLDDYLNNLTVGCIMRPITEKFKIARAKLAFLLDAMTTPLCVIIPATSWVAFILSQLDISGISEKITPTTRIVADTYNVYLNSIPFMLYPITLICSAWFIVRNEISFGLMAKHEKIAIETGNLFGENNQEKSTIPECKTESSIFDFIVPISSFLLSIVFVLLYSGDWNVFGGNNTFLQALLKANPFLSLFIASLFSLCISFIYAFSNKRINIQDSKIIIKDGFDLTKNSLIVLLLAWTFGYILENNLYTGKYLANLLLSILPKFALPLTIFVTAIAISAGTGSAWGTMAILFPLSIPMVLAFENLTSPAQLDHIISLFPIIGSLISGTIAGGHLSPISDSCVVSSTSAGVAYIDHFKTQLGYISTSIIGSIMGFIIIGVFATTNKVILIPMALLISIVTSFSILYIKNKYAKN